MAITDFQLKNLTNNPVSIELLQNNGLCDDYYIKPLVFIEDTLNIKLTCTGAEYKHFCEMANDDDINPQDGSLYVVADGILAFAYADKLEKCGLDLTTYFTYRFFPPSREFQDKLDKFKAMVKEAIE